ncbi:MAG: OmpH family outer membrane protein [Planctomycetes bacterium]|nr:OmpH family outer membrane protein [Planctomycetota bacterium]MCP4771777.1 OmpH family outer membrane protein [Planctomycetota bacterium]MCP4860980.1 OmpH family outer membrane protein [Planctomycetota bacterium]
MKTKSLILVLVLALGGSLFADRFAAEANESVRYVDVQKVIEGWDFLQEQSNLLREQTTAQLEQLKADNAELELAIADLDQYDKNSEEYVAIAFSLGVQESNLQEREKFLQANFRRRSARLLDAGVRRIHMACSELGEREGFSAILMSPPPLPGPEVQLQDSVMDMQGRWVVWSNNTFDISDQVIEMLKASN